MSFINLQPKGTHETVRTVFDFSSRVPAGEVIYNATVSATVYSGTDVAPEELIKGSATIDGYEVSQKIGAGTLGVTYLLTCTAYVGISARPVQLQALLTAASDAPMDLDLAPVVDFTANQTSGYPPLSVIFTDSSTKNPISWSWLLEEVNGLEPDITSTEQNPTLSIPTGTWTVTLEAANLHATGSKTRVEYIVVSPPMEVTLTPSSSSVSGSVDDGSISSPLIESSVSGGFPPYTYAWMYLSGDFFNLSNPLTDPDQIFSSDEPEDSETFVGIYRLTVTDSEGNSNYADVEITQAWTIAVTYATWDPASPNLNSWVLSNADKTAALGNTSPVQTVVATVTVQKTVTSHIRALEFKVNSVGPLVGDKTYGFGFDIARSVTVVDRISYDYYSGGATLDIAAAAMASGVRVLQAVPIPVANDYIAYTVDFTATNPVLKLYRNGSLIAGPYTLSTSWNAPGFVAMASNVGSLGQNAITLTMNSRPSQMQYYANYGANSGWWVPV